ncbi:MAG TPA: glycosyl hydrolase family 28-related protein [Gemmatimonadales bacterium]|nr:glycosyl hydrolase family 28-related protein [Gemmatimonadales bacterium]
MERRSFLGGMVAASVAGAPTMAWGRRAGEVVGPQYDVRQYGAQGDGRTDDAPAIRRALADSERAAGVVYFPPGDYLIGAPLTLPAGRAWHLAGAGRGLTRLRLGGPAKTGEMLRCAHTHLRTEFGCVLEDLTLEAAQLPGSALTLAGQTLFSMRRVAIRGVTGGSGLVLEGTFDSYFEDVLLEDCGNRDHPSVICRSAPGRDQSINNCVFVNLHIENTSDTVFVDIDGSGASPADTLQFFGLKVHGSPKGGTPTQPLIRLGQHAIGCSFVGGIVGWGSGVAQVEVDGQRNRFIGMDHGANAMSGRSPDFAYRFTRHATANHVISPNFKNGVGPDVYRRGLMRVERGASNNKLLFPQMSTGPLPLPRVLSDEGRGTAFIGDDVDDAGGLYIAHGLGVAPLNTAGISGTLTPARNLRGSVTMQGGTSDVEVRFATPEPDAVYYLTCTVTGVRGSPRVEATRVRAEGKSARGFTIRSEVPPGSGNAVTVDWMLIR